MGPQSHSGVPPDVNLLVRKDQQQDSDISEKIGVP